MTWVLVLFLYTSNAVIEIPRKDYSSCMSLLDQYKHSPTFFGGYCTQRNTRKLKFKK
jgi:hypothetical protein